MKDFAWFFGNLSLSQQGLDCNPVRITESRLIVGRTSLYMVRFFYIALCKIIKLYYTKRGDI